MSQDLGPDRVVDEQLKVCNPRYSKYLSKGIEIHREIWNQVSANVPLANTCNLDQPWVVEASDPKITFKDVCNTLGFSEAGNTDAVQNCLSIGVDRSIFWDQSIGQSLQIPHANETIPVQTDQFPFRPGDLLDYYLYYNAYSSNGVLQLFTICGATIRIVALAPRCPTTIALDPVLQDRLDILHLNRHLDDRYKMNRPGDVHDRDEIFKLRANA